MVKQEKNKYLSQPKLSIASQYLYNVQYVDYTTVNRLYEVLYKHWYIHRRSGIQINNDINSFKYNNITDIIRKLAM